jgi:tol-pal system beta propeller repeat protein TolB
MRTFWTKFVSTPLALCMAIALSCVSAPTSAQVTFSVQGTGQGTIRIDLSLSPGAGIDRGELLAEARLVQRDLHSSGFFSLAILAPGETSSQAGWQQSQGSSAYRVTLAAEANGASGRTIQVDVAPNGSSSPGLRRAFQVADVSQFLIGHTVSDILYEYFVGRVGYFASKIVFVREVREGRRRQSQIAASYSDGSDLSVLAESNEELASPHISPDGSMLVFTRITQNRPQLYYRDLRSNRSGPVFGDREVRFGPDIAPDGSIFYTKTVNGNADIYRAVLGSPVETRLTLSPSIETESAVSPAGDRMAYISDAAGALRLVVQNLASGNVQIYGTSGNYGSPSWSPDGKMLAFTKQAGGTFSIGYLNLETREERLVSTSYFEEHPAWAKNGRVILFERGEEYGGANGSTLWQVDLDSGRLARLPLTTPASDPDWVSR